MVIPGVHIRAFFQKHSGEFASGCVLLKAHGVHQKRTPVFGFPIDDAPVQRVQDEPSQVDFPALHGFQERFGARSLTQVLRPQHHDLELVRGGYWQAGQSI